MSQLDPTYKFFLEAGIVVLVLFLLVVLVGGTVFIAWRWIKYNEVALKAKREGREADEKAKQTDMELEEIRLKMVGELTTQIASLTTQIASQSVEISKDREHDRTIREKELKAVDELVKSVDSTSKLLKDHTDASVVFRSTMTAQSTAMLTMIGDANKGIADNTTAIHSVKTELAEFKQALIALPNAIQTILNPYCERMESALQKLETSQVEEKQNHVHAEEITKRSSAIPYLLDDHSVGVHSSNVPNADESGSTQPGPISNGNGEGGNPVGEGGNPVGETSQSADEDADRNTAPKSNAGGDGNATGG